MNTSHYGHVIASNAARSVALDEEVQKFLKAQGIEQPTQIPFRKSLWLEHCQETGKDPYKFTLGQVMTAAVEAAHAEKQKPKRKVKPEVAEESERLKFNREARQIALDKELKYFQGKCKKHGMQQFYIKGAGREHICCVCREINAQSQNEKRRKHKKAVAV